MSDPSRRASPPAFGEIFRARREYDGRWVRRVVVSSRLFHTVVGNAVIVVELEPDVRTTSLLFVTPLGDEGFALMDYLSTISLSRLGEKVGEITDPDARKRLRAAVRAAFSFADGE